MVALALVTYTATVTIQFNAFFVQGATSMTWGALTTSSGTRYFPNGANTTGILTPNSTIVPSGTTVANNFTFATQSTGKGYIQIAMGTAAPAADFQSFRVRVLTYNGTTTKWVNATMFTTSSFTTQLTNGLDGMQTATSAFIHVSGGSTLFYLIRVDYVLVGTPAGTNINVVFNETPSLS